MIIVFKDKQGSIFNIMEEMKKYFYDTHSHFSATKDGENKKR